jgi:hypothetical protein
MPTADNTNSNTGFFFNGSDSTSGIGSNVNPSLVRILKPDALTSPKPCQVKENGNSNTNAKKRVQNGRGGGGGGNLRELKLKGYVGFDKLATQFVSKQVKDGFSFNILCIGMLSIFLLFFVQEE